MPPEIKLKKLENLLEVLDASISREEFVDAFKGVIDYVKRIKTLTETELAHIKNSVDAAVARIESNADKDVAEAINTANENFENIINKLRFEVEALVAEIQSRVDSIRDGKDGLPGKDADEEKIVETVLSRIRIPEPQKETPESIRDALETLSGDERLDRNAIKGLETLENDVVELKKRPVSGSTGIALTVNGVYKGEIRNVIATGSGISTTVDAHGRLVLVFSGGAGSGSTAVETPSGAVNGENVSFTVANEPLYIIVDGIAKFVTIHYTYSSGTITITDGAPPTQYIRSVYSA